jgi:hypothetical protein
MKPMLPLVAVVLIAGCSAQHTTPAAQSPSAPSTVTVTVTPPASSPSASPVPAPSPSTPEASGPCSDDDLTVTNGPLEAADTQRHVMVSFTNTSAHTCTLVGYPGADLVTPAGGVLINVPRRPRCGSTSTHSRPRRRRHRGRNGLRHRHLDRERVPSLGQFGRHPAQRLLVAPAERRCTHLQRDHRLSGLTDEIPASSRVKRVSAVTTPAH